MSIDFISAEISVPTDAQPKPVTKQMPGTSSMPHRGSSPKTIATSSGAQPYTEARSEIHSTSPVTSSSASTGAARIAS